ncbi:hypothetical protein HMI56_007209 [Coelomomyces lativittatus]|nr:hypothetical protein HMI56_007209 [Coelomomyces lativittatus]
MQTQQESQKEKSSYSEDQSKPHIFEYSYGGVPYPPSASTSLLETVVSAIYNTVSKLASGVLSYVWSFFTPITDRIQYYTSTFYNYFKYLVNEYPIFRGFVYAFSLFSAVPIGLFLTYGAVTLGVCLAVAGFGLLVVEGALLGMGLLVLAPVLFVTFWSSLFCLGAYHTAYFVGSLFSSAVGRVQEVGALPAAQKIMKTVVKDMTTAPTAETHQQRPPAAA